ncbi:MAG: hypothetical protein ACTSV5_11875 [Promethearchaeota archaeon]
MIDHGKYLKAVNHPVRKAMLQIINDSNKISKSELLNKLKETNIMTKNDMFDYHMNFLLQTECVKKLDLENGKIEYEILQAGKVIKKY